MSFPEFALETLLAGAAGDADMQDLFGGKEAFEKIKKAQALQGEARRDVAKACAGLYATADGRALFEYLAGAYCRRFNNITALGLPMETAIQLHAERDGQRELVHDLFRLVHEGQQPKRTS